MPKQNYHKQTYTLESTTGEAIHLFGKVDPTTAVKPKVRMDIANNNNVTFKVTDGNGDPGRDFSAEATAEFLGDGTPPYWPDGEQDLIIGHLKYGTKDQQLFLIYVRRDDAPGDPAHPLYFKIFFFKAGTRYSNGNGPTLLTAPAVGQESGGGSGHGPN